MKKIFVLMLIALSLIFPLSIYSQSDDIQVYINDEKVYFEVTPEIINGRTMVPMRGIFEYLGAEIEWKESTRSVIAYREDILVKLQIDNEVMHINDECVNLDVSPVIKNDRTLVPLRVVSEAFGAEVEWLAERRRVDITTYCEMYALNGEKVTVAFADMEEMKKKGWSTKPNSSYYYNRIIAMKKDYPEGMRWTNENYYEWNAGIYSGGYGCYGFAFILSDAAFGDLPAKKVEGNIKIEMLKVGDILRINNDTHSVVVLEIHKDYIVIAEGNYNKAIHWGRYLSKDKVESADYYITRYK